MWLAKKEWEDFTTCKGVCVYVRVCVRACARGRYRSDLSFWCFINFLTSCLIRKREVFIILVLLFLLRRVEPLNPYSMYVHASPRVCMCPVQPWLTCELWWRDGRMFFTHWPLISEQPISPEVGGMKEEQKDGKKEGNKEGNWWQERGERSKCEGIERKLGWQATKKRIKAECLT